jgi:hypothetical protein
MPRKPRPEPAGKNRMIAAAAVVVVLILALAVGLYFFAPSLLGSGGTPQVPVATVAPTSIPVPVPTASAEPTTVMATTVQATTVPAAVTEAGIPQTGVWVRVKYDGMFTGSVGAPGRFREIAGTGSQFYQIPARNETVSASVQKQDDSGNKLTVQFFSEGQLIRSGSITAPHGTLNLDVDLRTA